MYSLRSLSLILAAAATVGLLYFALRGESALPQQPLSSAEDLEDLPWATPPSSPRAVRANSASYDIVDELLGLVPETVLLVRVLDDRTGEPVPGANVGIVRRTGREPIVRERLEGGVLRRSVSGVVEATGRDTNQAGVAQIVLPREGSLLSLSVRPTEKLPSLYQHFDLSLDRDHPVEVTMRLPAPGLITGMVVDSEGAPVPDAEVELWMGRWASDPNGWPAHRTATTGDGGRFLIKGVAGDITLIAHGLGLSTKLSLAKPMEPGELREGIELRLQTQR